MSAALKRRTRTDSASEELWRVSETDDVDELTRILSRVADVNARNQHGMTALMRAAHFGNAEMVRILLEHGADPNLVRNDRFTALALAAFFGHTETVRVLIEHGAKTEVVTRCGASAYTWAAARTFSEAASCLRAHKPVAVRTSVPVAAPASVSVAVPTSAPVPVPAPVAAPDSPAPPTKTLKDPPEIWDLVHEVPRNFDPRTAFLARLGSVNRAVAVCALAGVLLIVAGGVALLLMRGSHASVVTTVETISPPKVEKPVVETPVSPPQAEVPVLPANTTSNHTRRVQIKPRSSVSPIAVKELPKPEEPEIPAVVVADPPQVEKPKPKPKPVEGLSPQLVTPTQTAKPKPKVIQWP